MERVICQVPRTARNDLDGFSCVTLIQGRAHESRLRFRIGQTLEILNLIAIEEVEAQRCLCGHCKI